jgi:hypothetical protein
MTVATGKGDQGHADGGGYADPQEVKSLSIIGIGEDQVGQKRPRAARNSAQ